MEELFATRFCLLHWKLFEILRRFVRKADSFQRALQRSPRALRDVEHKSQMHLHWAPRPSLLHAPFMPASLAEGIIFQHFMHCRHNEVAARQTNRRIPSAESLEQNRSSFRPCLCPSACPVLPSLRLHLATISLYAHLFFPSFSLDSRSLSTFIISLGVCFAPAPSPPACSSSPPAIDHCGRLACRVMSCSICPV